MQVHTGAAPPRPAARAGISGISGIPFPRARPGSRQQPSPCPLSGAVLFVARQRAAGMWFWRVCLPCFAASRRLLLALLSPSGVVVLTCGRVDVRGAKALTQARAPLKLFSLDALYLLSLWCRRAKGGTEEGISSTLWAQAPFTISTRTGLKTPPPPGPLTSSSFLLRSRALSPILST